MAKKEKANHITPTVGRVVWFRPAKNDPLSKFADDQPLAGIVAHVNDDDTINISVLDVDGHWNGKRKVPLVQDGEDVPEGSYAEWMPYQKSKAAEEKAEK